MANMLNVSQFAQSYANHLPDPQQQEHSEVPAHGPQQNSVPTPGSTSVVDPKLTPEFQGLHDRLTAPIQGLAAKAAPRAAGAGADLIEAAAFL